MDINHSVAISALQHYIYCPRQCGLIHVAQVWSENLHTQKGRREHDRVDVPEYEVKAGMRIELGLTGKCDVVEFHADGSVYPVVTLEHSITRMAVAIEAKLKDGITVPRSFNDYNILMNSDKLPNGVLI